MQNNNLDKTINFYLHLRSRFELKDKKSFEFYLESIHPDFCTYNNNKVNLGISKIRFIDWAKLPIYICEKLFNCFDSNKDGFLSYEELKNPLSQLYFGTFEETAQIIFNLYDFDNDGRIKSEDVKSLLAFLPLKCDKTKIEYKYQLESLEELNEILKATFNSKESLNYKEFLESIQRQSDIYLQILCFLYQRCPFQEKSVKRAFKIRYYSHSCQNIRNISISLSPKEKKDNRNITAILQNKKY